jgi:IS30 family transposase
MPQHRIAAMLEEERSTVNSMHQNSYSPLQILSALQSANPSSCLIVKDIYNILYSLQLDELAGSTPIEWLLKVI